MALFCYISPLFPAKITCDTLTKIDTGNGSNTLIVNSNSGISFPSRLNSILPADHLILVNKRC